MIFSDKSALFNDLLFVSNTVVGLCLIAFFFSLDRPVVLLILLEIIYMCLNLDLLLIFLFGGFFYGPIYAILSLGISAAETLAGLSLIVQMYRLNLFTNITRSL